MKTFYIYILASHSRRLYTGMTSALERRVWVHKTAMNAGHTARYRIDRLVYYETMTDAQAARRRERQIKGWPRERKLRLVESMNAGWLDLSIDWYGKGWEVPARDANHAGGEAGPDASALRASRGTPPPEPPDLS